MGSGTFERITIDTTAQTKAVAHPTDSGLLLRAVEWLNRFARQQPGAAPILRAPRADRQALREVRRMRTYVGRLHRDIGRKIAGQPDLEAAFRPVGEPIARLLAQKVGDSRKLYALHAPEVECIAKGKAQTRFEFGVKASFAVTNARAGGGQFIAQARPGLPYDGHTLQSQIAQVERLTGASVERAYVDRGYRGHGLTTPQVYLSNTRGIASPTIKRELRRRSAVEPIIGHMKADGKLERHWLKGANDDAINVVLVAAGHNIRLLLAWLKRLCALIRAAILAASQRTSITITLQAFT